MNEYRGLLQSMPYWAELLLLAAFPAVIALVLVFNLAELAWLLAGPMAMAQVWINRDTSEYGRDQKPWLFWGSLAVFGLLTARGAFELFLRFFEVSV